jgi:PAS domain S-box-containing protein
MKYSIVRSGICNELDIVLAHKHTVQLSEMAGISLSDQTKLATAISEICRNCVEYADEGELIHEIEDHNGASYIQATVIDKGRGIPLAELNQVRSGRSINKIGRGIGLQHARKLTDYFDIISGPQGTSVTLGIRIPHRVDINETVVKEWVRFFEKEEAPASPYEEIRRRNAQLLDLSDQLKIKNTEIEKQLEEIRLLNSKLQMQNYELQLAHDKLNEEEEGFEFLSDNIPQIIWKTGPDGMADFVNKHWTDLTGLQIEDFYRYDGVSKAIHPDDIERISEEWQNCIQTGKDIELEYRLMDKNGKYSWYLCRGRAVYDKEQHIISWLGTIVDIDEKIRSAENLESQVVERTKELYTANKELSRSNQDLEQFAYVASHDLKEPIRMVSNFTNLMMKRYRNKMGDEADEFMGFISEGAQRMQMLIDDLLVYSRAGRRDTLVEQVEAREALQEALDRLHDNIENNGAVITYGTLPTVNTIKSTLVQVFQNLISNAIKFRGDATPQVHIEAVRDNDYWKFSVQDNGIGIDPAFQEKIFIIFQRLHTRDKFEGTGMGLAICKKIIELQDGMIWFESTPGQGSTFYFTLKAN